MPKQVLIQITMSKAQLDTLVYAIEQQLESETDLDVARVYGKLKDTQEEADLVPLS